MTTEYIPRLKVKYNKKVISYLSNQLDISNPMRVPRLTKVVLILIRFNNFCANRFYFEFLFLI